MTQIVLKLRMLTPPPPARLKHFLWVIPHAGRGDIVGWVVRACMLPASVVVTLHSSESKYISKEAKNEK